MKIAIAGYGVEGESNYRYWSSDASNQVTIADEKLTDSELPHGVRNITGIGAFSRLQDFDMVVRTAGLAPKKIVTNGKIWSGTNEFFAKCPAMIIGITGSKGKGTTASLIASILREAGRKVWLVGNIGQPAIDVLDKIAADDIVVFELSSFQLWDLEKSPHIAVVLFIEQEHLDVHANMEEYISAKANIAKFQTPSDMLIFNSNNQYAKSIAGISKAKTVGYTSPETTHICDDNFYYGEQKICSINALKIIGKHNYDNACAAIDAIWNIVSEPVIIERGLSLFVGLPHRLQFVREVNGVRYYDDSIATTPSSAIAALRTFDGPKVIILGGSSKGANFSELADEMANHDVAAILIGDEADNIAKAFDYAGFKNYEKISFTTMSDVVNRAQLKTSQNGVVLLSPSSASFGLFKNYVDRGEQFQAAVRDL